MIQKYKCRLCGCIHTDAVGSFHVALKDITEFIAGAKQRATFGADLHRVHLCADGSIGVSDFLGYAVQDGDNDRAD